MGTGKREDGEVERFVRTVKKVIKSKVGAQELQARVKQNAEELPRYDAQHYKSCSGDSIVWRANEDKAT